LEVEACRITFGLEKDSDSRRFVFGLVTDGYYTAVVEAYGSVTRRAQIISSSLTRKMNLDKRGMKKRGFEEYRKI